MYLYRFIYIFILLLCLNLGDGALVGARPYNRHWSHLICCVHVQSADAFWNRTNQVTSMACHRVSWDNVNEIIYYQDCLIYLLLEGFYCLISLCAALGFNQLTQIIWWHFNRNVAVSLCCVTTIIIDFMPLLRFVFCKVTLYDTPVTKIATSQTNSTTSYPLLASLFHK